MKYVSAVCNRGRKRYSCRFGRNWGHVAGSGSNSVFGSSIQVLSCSGLSDRGPKSGGGRSFTSLAERGLPEYRSPNWSDLAFAVAGFGVFLIRSGKSVHREKKLGTH